MIWVGVVSLFPKMFQAITDYGITRRAIAQGSLQLQCWNPRDFTKDKRQTVDDRPYGGGPGMLMLAQPMLAAIKAATRAAQGNVRVIYLSPQGRKFNHKGAAELARYPKLILIAGRYEGIDERIIQSSVDEEWSIGDYILSGGELPAMVIIDAIVRLLPGALGNKQSTTGDSFTDGLLHYPQYTRPEILNDMAAPSVLLSGDHENIRRWRLQQSLVRTYLRRTDLLNNLALTDEQEQLLAQYFNKKQTNTVQNS